MPAMARQLVAVEWGALVEANSYKTCRGRSYRFAAAVKAGEDRFALAVVVAAGTLQSRLAAVLGPGIPADHLQTAVAVAAEFQTATEVGIQSVVASSRSGTGWGPSSQFAGVDEPAACVAGSTPPSSVLGEQAGVQAEGLLSIEAAMEERQRCSVEKSSAAQTTAAAEEGEGESSAPCFEEAGGVAWTAAGNLLVGVVVAPIGPTAKRNPVSRQSAVAAEGALG